MLKDLDLIRKIKLQGKRHWIDAYLVATAYKYYSDLTGSTTVTTTYPNIAEFLHIGYERILRGKRLLIKMKLIEQKVNRTEKGQVKGQLTTILF